jgi:hypothetical protein
MSDRWTAIADKALSQSVKASSDSISQHCPNCEAQAAEIERLREALTSICWTTIAPKAHKIAQAALAGKAEQ